MKSTMSWRVATVLVLATQCLLLNRHASANISPPCQLDGKLWSTTTINIYISTHTTQSLSLAIGKTFSETERIVLRTLNLVNEEYGSSIKLAYAGTTTATGYVAGAIVFKGNSSTCPSDGRFADAPRQFSGSTAIAGLITFYKKTGACNIRTWSLLEQDLDFVQVALHELGHAVFDMAHPNDDEEIENGNCETFFSYR